MTAAAAPEPAREKGRDAILAHLRASPCFADMPGHVLAAFADIAQWRTLAHGELFASRGSEAPGVVLIIRGAIHTSSFSGEGHEFALSMLEFRGLWGLAAVLDGGGMMRDSRACQETEILILPKPAFLAIVEREPGLYRHFVTLLCQRIRTAHAIIDELALRTLNQRLPRLLCALSADRPATERGIAVPQTQDTLATLMGVSRNAVNRELKQLESLGLVGLGYGGIWVRDVAGLKALYTQADPA
ncbi:Crp/Fnr family transcriptional regulator [Bordetella hinzii]|uniref:Crp/Fnr family transcriptional regulator n=1 Tax=Bordetella hinzii TaxID=103855 RepID=UPI0003FDDEAF|nr:Crp/Fnr family transcriptional regulator [Bordetella hinzii]AKQ56472.1 HTH-type transcriptional regulator Cmr [Bordetella hinzii]AKQ60930.1 HTH-type transcriptional regulator Cmr [Bordetella hinzii]KCB30581.1 Crp-like helix-turn-helix domain protein [Bordetella hinzii L60]KCB32359.1 Crp-like helix-turn-helix domain protein [Bordetella hinzii CA90 BAL1384]KCB48935.1 Crp-like helix-turn-helix domain protein [Bordetella hinzii 4161]